MKGLRIALYLLLLINLASLGVIAMPWLGMQSPFDGSVEPDRLANQLYPERLKIVSSSLEPASGAADGSAVIAALPAASDAQVSAPQADVSAPSAASATLASATSSATSAPVQVASAPVAANTQTCVAFMKLTPAQAQSLVQRGRKDSSGLIISEGEEGPSAFWVNIPPQGGKAGAERRAAELKALGLEDFFIVKEAGDSQYAISLGLFHAESLAQRQVETLLKKGVKGATVTARKAANNAYLEVSGAAGQIEQFAKDGSADLTNAVRAPCKTQTPGA